MMDATPTADATIPANIINFTGSTGSRGSGTLEPLESLGFPGADAGTPSNDATGSTGSALADPAGDAATRAARGAASMAGIQAGESGGLLSISGPTAPDATADPGAEPPPPAPPDESLTMLPYMGDVLPEPRMLRFGDMPEPTRSWVYRDADGRPLVIVARYETVAADGTVKKDVRPWTHGRRLWIDRNGKPRDSTNWHCKAPPEPRPLYGLDRLAARLDAPVVVCEGEKSADAASALFPASVAITSQGGSKAAGKSDWGPLSGRHVVIWPDNDEPGAAYAATVADLAKRAGALSCRIVDVPEGWPPGWDVADPLPDGVPAERLREMVDDAPDGAAAELPPGFSMTKRGLFFTSPATEKNPDPPPIFVSAPFRVIGETRSDTSEGWGLFIRWRDREGKPHQWAIPRRMIHRPGNEIAEELEHAGLSCGPDGSAHQMLKRFVGGVKVSRLLRCVTRTGWHQSGGAPVFVLPGGEAFGRGASDVILQADHAGVDAAYRAEGALADWQANVAALAVGNDRLALFVSAAFAGPLLDVLGEPSGGLHLVGDSRTGKSTAAVVAASVWGRPTADAQVRQWRGTANGLEATAAETSDTLLILDEMGQADAREVADVVYMLANESGKQRASRTGTARRRQSWRALFLSTGELTLAAKMGEAGKRAMAGLEVRLVNLPANAGAGLGLFQCLHGRAGAAALAEELRAAARAHHGTAARAFLFRLAMDRASDGAELRETLDEMRAGFIAEHVPDGAAGQVRSVAQRFAMIGAAGELAAHYGVLPWPEGEAMRAAGACFAAWLAERGGTGAGEDAAALAQVRQFLEAHGESRFTALVTQSVGQPAEALEIARTVNRTGWRRRAGGGGDDERWEYLISPEMWKREVCRGHDPKRVADLLAARGWLTGGDARHRAGLVMIPGEGKRRVYRVSGAILGDDAAETAGDGAG